MRSDRDTPAIARVARVEMSTGTTVQPADLLDQKESGCSALPLLSWRQWMARLVNRWASNWFCTSPSEADSPDKHSADDSVVWESARGDARPPPNGAARGDARPGEGLHGRSRSAKFRSRRQRMAGQKLPRCQPATAFALQLGHAQRARAAGDDNPVLVGG